MGIISGIGGAVDGIDTMRTWMISSSSDLKSFVASNTRGGTGRLPGNIDWSGSYTAYGHTPVKLPGELFLLNGSIDGTNGVTSEENGTIVDSVEVTCDIEGGNIIAHTVNFSGNGALTFGAADAVDETVANPPSAIGCKLMLGTAVALPSYSNVVDVRNWRLTISAANQSYVSSDTAGLVKRTAGNIDATFDYSVYADDFADLIEPGAIKAVKLYVSPTLFWELKWVVFGEASNIEVNRETAAVVGASQSGGFSGTIDIGGIGTVGSIITPAPSTFWPVV